MSDPRTGRCICASCGHEIPAWYPAGPLLQVPYDVDADDQAYERWLDTECPNCGATPQEKESRAVRET